MKLLFPWGLLALSLIPVLLLIHLLRVPGRTKIVSFLPLWEKVLSRFAPSRTSPRRRFDVLFLLEALAVALLAFALAQTAFRWAARPPRVALVIDMTASMDARVDAGHTRIDLARNLARTFLQQFDPDDQVTLLECFDADTVSRLKLRTRDVLRALQSAQPRSLSGSGDEIFQRCVMPIARDYDVVAFITDALSPETAAASPSVLYATVGTPCDNVGITRWASAGLADGRVQLFVSLLNSSPTARTGVLITADDSGASVASREFTLEPHGTSDYVLDLPADKTRLALYTAINGKDDFPVDDGVYAIALKLRVGLIGEPSAGVTRFFHNVLPRVEVAQLPQDSTVAPDDRFDLFIVSGTGQVPQGDFPMLVMNPPQDKVDDVALDPYRPFGDNLAVAPADDTLMASVDVRGVRATRYRTLKAPEGYRPLLFVGDTPIAVVRRLGPHRPCVILGFSPDEGWAKDPSFVIFMVNLMREVSPTGELPERPFVPWRVGMTTPYGMHTRQPLDLKPALLSASESELACRIPAMDQPARLALPSAALATIWQPVTSILAMLLAVVLFLWWCWPR